MKRLSIFVFLAAIVPHISVAQSISVAPTSVTGFSKTPYTSEVMISYSIVDVHIIYVSKKVFKGQTYKRPDFQYGITLSPEVFLKYISIEPIVGYYNKRVASSYYGSRWNFGFSIYRNIFPHIDIYIRHLSNAGIGELNPGIDWIGIRARL